MRSARLFVLCWLASLLLCLDESDDEGNKGDCDMVETLSREACGHAWPGGGLRY